ncbi:Nif3-like dinuclear metal center hexameric protein [Taylorella equigenitalis]|uniref:Nif3-like dinuclear metal center hexameric protein n=1 Tax=Taylorella equigenitalis TaxID=29575 RepID=UPI00237CF5D7|nr:Nif3-like dinuclear metal center hexameric protein [Taylorella equigenitalis]WDU53246.1 Nif3-like dinuclear metal center hexameric protein [Taylorella equigenitalis]
MSSIRVDELQAWLDDTLKPTLYNDYAPNGLQLQGKSEIRKIVVGVTASEALINQAIKNNADAIIVHHGWFWKNEDSEIIGIKYNRIATAIKNNLNVFAYHLPLDAHPEYGNNAQLAKVLDIEVNLILKDEVRKPETHGKYGLIWFGNVPPHIKMLEQLEGHVAQRLNRKPLVVGNPDMPVSRIAWCTGGAQGYFMEAIDKGADVYLTGEASEQCYHQAIESSVGFIAAGHHATERYGVQALGAALKAKYPQLEVEYIELNNPI